MAAAAPIVFLKDVYPGMRKRVATVKLLSMWSSTNESEGPKIRMLLSDVVGTKIIAHIPMSYYQHKWQGRLQEGRWYYLEDFHVIVNMDTTFRTPHEYQLQLHCNTSMNRTYSRTKGNYFDFRNYVQINSGSIPAELLFDYYGIVADIGEIFPPRKLELGLIDQSGQSTIFIAKGQGFIEEFMNNWRNQLYHLTSEESPVFVVLRFTKKTKWEDGEIYLTDEIGCSRFYTNPKFPEIRHIKEIHLVQLSGIRDLALADVEENTPEVHNADVEEIAMEMEGQNYT